MIKKLIDALQHKYDGFIGNRKDQITSANAEGFKEGLAWAIESAKTSIEQSSFETYSKEDKEIINKAIKYCSYIDFSDDKNLSEKGRFRIKEWAKQDFIAGANWMLNK